MGRDGKGWTEHFRSRFAGHPLKSVSLRVGPRALGAGASLVDSAGTGLPPRFERQGEFVITDSGVEGSLVYAASALLRDDLAQGPAHFLLDLLPGKPFDQVLREVSWPRGSRSLSSHLKSRLGIDGVKMGLLYELCSPQALAQPETLADSLKGLVIALEKPRPVAEAISTAGGVEYSGVTPEGRLLNRPDVYCAGEMMDWEAPTGGYLLTACLASGRSAGLGILTNL
jgi:predicted flavoprotein YhiN